MTALAIAVPLAVALVVLGLIARDVVLRVLRQAHWQADAARENALIRLDAERLDGIEARMDEVAAESHEVATRARAAGLGERLGRR